MLTQGITTHRRNLDNYCTFWGYFVFSHLVTLVVFAVKKWLAYKKIAYKFLVMLYYYQILHSIFFYQLVFFQLAQVLYFYFKLCRHHWFALFEWTLAKLSTNAFFHSKTEVHKFRSMRPTINQFQKRNT